MNRCGVMTGIKYLETIPLDAEIDINLMQTKVLEDKLLKKAGGGPLFKKKFLLMKIFLQTKVLDVFVC